jgi:hypothetical protein
MSLVGVKLGANQGVHVGGWSESSYHSCRWKLTPSLGKDPIAGATITLTSNTGVLLIAFLTFVRNVDREPALGAHMLRNTLMALDSVSPQRPSPSTASAPSPRIKRSCLSMAPAKDKLGLEEE